MAGLDFKEMKQPTFYFIGVTTCKSSIMRVFPEWARFLELDNCQIKGIDCKQHDDPEIYRRIVSFIKKDKLSLGALVTTHKIDLLKAAIDIFDELGYYASLLGEVSCISKRDGKLIGHAKDPITSGLSLQAFLPDDYWKRTGAEIFIMGAGGSSLALTVHLMRRTDSQLWPSRLVVSNRSTARLEQMETIHSRINTGMNIEYVHTPEPELNDREMERLKDRSLVINATGLGKDAAGSPITDAAQFPSEGLAWDFNYRGDLVFLEQALAQQKQKRLSIQDGWVYFIHGWTRVMEEVFHIEIPTSGPVFDELSTIAARMR